MEGLKLLNDKSKTIIQFRGGSRSGKSHLIAVWIFLRMLYYPGSSHLCARFVRARARQTVWAQTILPMAKMFQRAGLCTIHDSNTEMSVRMYNDSFLLIDGLEPSRIDGVLGSERGTIWLNECNENAWRVVQLLFSRLNDTARHEKTGEIIVPKLVADNNPTTKASWDYKLFIRKIHPTSNDPHRKVDEIASMHFHPSHNRENQSPGYIEMLESGSREFKQRFLEGEYGSSKGLVYSINEDVHVIDGFEPPPPGKPRKLGWTLARAVDFGYWPDPFVCLWMAYDQAKNKLYFYREWQAHKMLVRSHAHMMYQLSAEDHGVEITDDEDEFYASQKKGAYQSIEDQYDWTECDHDREDRETLEAAGIRTQAADKRRDIGHDHVIDLLHYDLEKGKKPTIYIDRRCVNLLTEFESYRWIEEGESKKKDQDRETRGPDHCMDCLRYGSMRMIPPFNASIFGNFGKTETRY